MTPESQTLTFFIDYMMLMSLQNAKNNAVKKQDFKEALRLRDKEVELEKSLPTFEQLEELKNSLQ